MRNSNAALFTSIALAFLLVALPPALGLDVPTRPIQPSGTSPGNINLLAPLVIVQQGDTVWVEAHLDTTYCPGDPDHGGEATGGPGPSETWCFEGGYGDSCGTNPPWDVSCFDHVDMRSQPSPSGKNYWHVTQYDPTPWQPYLALFGLWCGVPEFVTPGGPDRVECGAWAKAPGYGNDWNCIAELTLPSSLFCWGDGCSLMFDVKYDLECKHDYLYVEFYYGGEWLTLATFNATSFNPGAECGVPAGGSPDYWDNTDIDRFANCDWEPRVPSESDVPAFHVYIGSDIQWREIGTSVQPAPRFSHAMAYDSARDRVVLFGGRASDAGPYFDDTWEFSGLWGPKYPVHRPAPRSESQMAYDAALEKVVLFGGIDEYSAPLGDTWLWTGVDWVQLSPAHSPPARYGHAMAYDAARGEIVLFGGDGGGGALDDTWIWDGTDWTEASPASRPTARRFEGGCGLAYEPTRGRCILHGGSDGLGTYYDDTYEWTGTDWVFKGVTPDPRPRDGHALAACLGAGGMVQFGGRDDVGTVNAETAIYVTSWNEESPPARPKARRGHAMVHDSGEDRVILFGGLNASGDIAMDDTWKMLPDPIDLNTLDTLRFRWRMVTDGAWSDQDGLGDTQGGAFIDNVEVVSDCDTYLEDFEVSYLDTVYWSLPDPDPIAEFWHLEQWPYTPPRGETCVGNSSWIWEGRPPFPGSWPYPVSGFHYRLLSPVFPMHNTGCVVQYDQYMCARNHTCDQTDTRVRFYRSWSYGYEWCPWVNIDGYNLIGGCSFWNIDFEEDVSAFYGAEAESVQFAWDLMDVSKPGDPCRNRHSGTQNLVDNVSIGFFDGSATRFMARTIDLFHDTFHTGLCLYNSFFPAYDDAVVLAYDGGVELPAEWQLRVDVTDENSVCYVDLLFSMDGGMLWHTKPMTLDIPANSDNPGLGGVYVGSCCPSDLYISDWAPGTELWYCVRAEDCHANVEYLPATADPGHPDHTNTASDYFVAKVLPDEPLGCEGPRVLLVDGYGRNAHDFAPCLSTVEDLRPLEDIYVETLSDLSLCCDIYNISGAGSSVSLHPIWFDMYDIVIWFTGPYLSQHLTGPESRQAIIDYLGQGGKMIFCGDRLAYDAYVDAYHLETLAMEFCEGVLGIAYEGEVESASTLPYLYLEAYDDVDITIGGDSVTIAVPLDTLLIYRECPAIKDMSYVLANSSSPAGYKVQPLIRVLNSGVPEARAATYVECNDVGQCVFLNFDISGLVNHNRAYCTGTTPAPAGPFTAGNYDGRVELLGAILGDIMGDEWAALPDRPDDPGGERFEWALRQNRPNPCASGTEIRYEVARPGHVAITVYSATGRYVCGLIDKHHEPGRHSARWDGKNASGTPVANGVYFYRMDAAGFSSTRKMVLVR